MTDDVRERGCKEYGEELAELALGVLTGRDRARAAVEPAEGRRDE